MLKRLTKLSANTIYKVQIQCKISSPTYYTFYELTTIAKQDLSGKKVMSLARSGKLVESMELFDIIKSKNTKLGVKSAIKLLNVLIQQSESSILSISHNAAVPLDFGYNIYRLIMDNNQGTETQTETETEFKLQLWNTMFVLFKQYQYPTDKIYSMWNDIKKSDIHISMDITKQIIECFIDKPELKYTMEIVKWFHNNNNNNSNNTIAIDDDLYVKILKQCIAENELEFGKYIYCECRDGLQSVDALCLCLDIYNKCGEDINKIWNDIIDKANDKKEIDNNAWNIMCQLYAKNGDYEKLMFLYQEMKENDIEANKYTFISLINVCSNILNLEKGKSIHLDMIKMQNKSTSTSKLLQLQQDVDILTALLNMYSKCGDFINSLKHWNDLKKEKEVINIQHWNCMINAHAICGNTDEILELYKELKKDVDIKPNDVTYTMIVDVLNRKGMVDKAKEILNDMDMDNNNNTNNNEDILSINRLSRSGKFEEAEKMINLENIKSSNIMWMTLLSACRRYNDIERAKKIYKHIVCINGNDENSEYCQSAKLLLANIYGAIKQPIEEKQIRLQLSRNGGFKKTPGISFIEIDGKQHKFFAHYKGHEKNHEIWKEIRRLTEIMKNEYDYVPNPRWVTRQLKSHETVESYLMGHSERLAFAFANISTPAGSKLIIGKNLRICGDCHDVFKLFSSITGRLILCRDAKRFHHFENGKCSCNDFW